MTTATSVPVPVAAPETLKAVRGTLQNLAAGRRREWCPIAVPFGSITAQEAVFITDRGLRLRASFCEHVGDQSSIYRVFAPFDERQRIPGELRQYQVEPTAPPFELHPWVKDSPAALLPRTRLWIAGRLYEWAEWVNGPRVTEQTNCMQRWSGLARVVARDPFSGGPTPSGMLAWFTTTFYHRSPVADFRAAIDWSDRTNPAHDLQVDEIQLVTGEIVKFDWHLRNVGMADPVRDAQGQWVNGISGPIGFIDGSFIPLVGRMLCLPQTTEAIDPDDYASDVTQDVETLYAAHNGPVYGVADAAAWDGRFLAHRNVPRIADIRGSRAALLSGFAGSLQQVAGWYAPRPVGLGRNPSQTGDQQDFGSAKGWEAFEDARWLDMALYSVLADAFRGIAHYEADGQRLDPARHPDWRSWSGVTHFSTSVSPDRLGKAPPAWGQGISTGWGGYDDEHRSRRNAATVLLLTGDPLMRFLLDHYSTSDIANVRFRLGQGYGAPRAWARMAHEFADNMLLSTGTTSDRYRLLLADLAAKLERDFLGHKASGPVKVMAVRNDPRVGITKDGQSVDSWNWEHGLFVTHLYAAWKATGDQRFLAVVKAVARTIVRYGTMQDANGGWWICSAVAYLPDGQPLPADAYHMPVSGEPSKLVFPERGGTATWVLPAILVFIETHAADDPDMARAMELARFFDMDSVAVAGRDAEWGACVASDPPKPVPAVGDLT